MSTAGLAATAAPSGTRPPVAPAPRDIAPPAARTGWREHGPSLLVASLSSAFGVALLQVTGFLAAVISADDLTGSSATVRAMLQVVALVFIAIAVYVGAVITVNTVATIVAGRVRSIALMRLLGSTASAQRRVVAREGLAVGAAGAVIGALAGTAAAILLTRLAIAGGSVPDVPYSWLDPVLVLPIAGVFLTTWLASWAGSRRVLSVTPLQALAGSGELSREQVARRPGRNVAAVVLVAIGSGLLLLALVLGLATPVAVLVGALGGILSFTGVVLAAEVFLPPALRLTGRVLARLSGGGAAARLAAENADRYPQRSARATIGLVIGVTLLQTFGVAMASFLDLLQRAFADSPEIQEANRQVVDGISAVFGVLIGFSAVIAAVGLVNNLSVSVLQRTRELGLLRALGFSAGQLRRLMLSEAAQLTITAVVIGLLLGTFYGWVGAQSLLGSVNGVPGIVPPAIPWTTVAVVVVGGAMLTAVASWAPARRATRVSPMVALAAD